MSLIDAVERMIANWVSPIKQCNELGLPAVYVRATDGEVAWQFPDGEIVSDEDDGGRALAVLNAAVDSERSDMVSRIRTRYEALTGKSSGGSVSVDWDTVFDEIADEA